MQGYLNGRIEINCRRHGAVFVTIRDWGRHFGPRKIAEPKIDDPFYFCQIGGLGLFFMYKMMDHVDFSFSNEKGNLLTMAKKIQK